MEDDRKNYLTYAREYNIYPYYKPNVLAFALGKINSTEFSLFRTETLGLYYLSPYVSGKYAGLPICITLTAHKAVSYNIEVNNQVFLSHVELMSNKINKKEALKFFLVPAKSEDYKSFYFIFLYIFSSY